MMLRMDENIEKAPTRTCANGHHSLGSSYFNFADGYQNLVYYKTCSPFEILLACRISIILWRDMEIFLTIIGFQSNIGYKPLLTKSTLNLLHAI
jgi:hypothetical protein